MILARCPVCGREFQTASARDWPGFPFCSERCKLVDLGRWLNEGYATPGPPVAAAPNGREPQDDGDDG